MLIKLNNDIFKHALSFFMFIIKAFKIEQLIWEIVNNKWLSTL